MSRRIRVLPPEVVNQIAAGEVVERPFSVVKELVENSLDAGATRLRVELEDGGLAKIRITDDGRGFLADDLELAFVSHATSKLAELADLDHVASLGFRGEALASIGSVSRTRIQSRPATTAAADGAPSDGAEIRCEGGVISPVRPCGTPPGTIIEVCDLFYNTPARRRFLKGARAERARIQDLLIRITLPRIDVDVTLVSEGKVVLHLPAGESLEARVGRAFGRTYSGRLWSVGPHEAGPYRVSGLIAEPELSRRDSSMELTWINGRATKDRSVLFAVREAYRGFMLHGRYPVYFLMLDMPPDLVDVNVHPTKVEVRFAEPRRAASAMHRAVQQALLERGGSEAEVAEAGAGGSPRPAGAPGRSRMPLPPADPGPRASTSSRPPSASSLQPKAGFPRMPSSLFEVPPARGVARADESRGPAHARARADAVAEPSGPLRGVDPGAGEHPFSRLAESRFLQVHDLYVVLGTPDGMAIVDQHALHERVVYERFKRRHESKAPDVQRLLMPAVVDLAPLDKEWLLSASDDLAGEGLLVEDFGGPAVAVHGLPAALGTRVDPERLIRGLFDGSDRPSAKAEVLERFHSMACRSSVMSGDRLDESEIQALLEEATRLEHPHNCPHGRPTVLQFDLAQLERWFRRRV